jgi:hypothetical protein
MFNTKRKRELRALNDNINELYEKLKVVRTAVNLIGEQVVELNSKHRSAILAILGHFSLEFDLNDKQELYVKKGSSKTSSKKERGFTNNKVKKETVAVDKKNNSVRGKTSSKRK